MIVQQNPSSPRGFVRPGVRSGVRPGVWPDVRPDVRPDGRQQRACRQRRRKKSFDRGGPVWPPRSNVTNDRLEGGALPPQPKIGESGGQRPPAKKNDVTVTYRNRRLTKPYVPDIVTYGG